MRPFKRIVDAHEAAFTPQSVGEGLQSGVQIEQRPLVHPCSLPPL